MKQHYDAIVIGLGPGGTGAASQLALSGARVLALDGSGGRAKPCGGCISLRWRWLFEWLGAPDWLYEHTVDHLWLSAPGRQPLHCRSGESGAYLVDRKRLDRWLAGRAAELGAMVLASRAREIRPQGRRYAVRTDEGEFSCDWLIGAEGAGGLSSRKLGLGRPGWVYLGIAEERPLPMKLASLIGDGALLELGGAPGGYGWIFPRQKKVNLGMGFWQRNNHGGVGDLIRNYKRFLARHGLAGSGPVRGAAIPCPGVRPAPVCTARAAVVGDAAALADPFLGEGIGPALYSGRLAAQAITAGDISLYPAGLKRGLLAEHRHGWLMARIFYSIGGLTQTAARRWPGAVELGFSLLRGELRQARLWPAAAAMALGGNPALDHPAKANYIRHLKV